MRLDRARSGDVGRSSADLERISDDQGGGRRTRRIGRAGGASLLTVSRLDGSFGLSGLSARSCPVSGALAGLAKTAACEWPLVNCKAIDVDAAFDVPDGAARVIVEEFFKRGPSEVGLSRQGRTVIELEAEPAAARPPRRGGGVLWRPATSS